MITRVFSKQSADNPVKMPQFCRTWAIFDPHAAKTPARHFQFQITNSQLDCNDKTQPARTHANRFRRAPLIESVLATNSKLIDP